MANAYKCDRCGLLFSKRPSEICLTKSAISIQQICYEDQNNRSPAFDLCEDCAISFVSWWNRANIEY